MMIKKINYRIVIGCIGILTLVNNCKCGDDVQEFIWKGEKADKGEVPWQVAIVHRNESGLNKLCGGGVIIDEKWVLTAAHLFKNYNRESDYIYETSKDSLEILAGTNDLLSTKKKVGIEEVIVPTDYKSCGAFNDIALIKLKDSLNLDTLDKQYIFAPDDSQYLRFSQEGVELKISGWGYDENSQIQRSLQVGSVPIANHDECRESNFKVRNIVTEDMLCAGHRFSGGVDTCKGDSGGPLYVFDENNKPILLGLTSWGEGCSSSGLYGIYTNFYYYIKWVNDNCDDCLKFTTPSI